MEQERLGWESPVHGGCNVFNRARASGHSFVFPVNCPPQTVKPSLNMKTARITLSVPLTPISETYCPEKYFPVNASTLISLLANRSAPVSEMPSTTLWADCRTTL